MQCVDTAFLHLTQTPLRLSRCTRKAIRQSPSFCFTIRCYKMLPLKPVFLTKNSFPYWYFKSWKCEFFFEFSFLFTILRNFSIINFKRKTKHVFYIIKVLYSSHGFAVVFYLKSWIWNIFLYCIFFMIFNFSYEIIPQSLPFISIPIP